MHTPFSSSHNAAPDADFLLLAGVALDSARDQVLWADAGGRLIYANRSACSALEYPREELLSMTVSDICPGLPPHTWAEHWRELKAAGDLVLEVRQRDRSGNSTLIQISATYVQHDGQEFCCAFGREIADTEEQLRDITQSRQAMKQKETEEALRQSHILLSNLSLQVPGALFQSFLFPDGRVCTPYASEKLHDVYELSPDQVRESNAPIFDRFHPDDYDRVMAGIFEATAKVVKWECEYRVLLPRQGLKWLYGAALPQKLDDGTVVFYGIIMDITERKRIEESLSHSRKLLASIVENAPSAFFVKDVEDDFRVILWNRAAENFSGRTAAEMLGKTAHDLWPKEQADAFLDLDRSVVASRTPIDIPELVSSHGEKGDIYLHIRKVPLFDNNGNVSHVLVISDDITERRMMLTELVKTQKLESLGVLAGGIAHDFNNILTGVIGNISFARAFIDSSHQSAKILMEAEKAAHRAADLARQLLTFAKGSQPVKKLVSVRHILEESASLVLRGSNVSIDIVVPYDLPAIEVDEGQISQVINNLLINASQAMPGGGMITLRGESLAIDAGNVLSLAPGRHVRLSVSDAGCGIPEEDQKRIFDPYFTTKPGGSGLGLASAHSIIKKHAGYIGFHSVVGKGTTFELLLPASEEQIIPDVTGTFSVAFGEQNDLSVLVMDDEEIIRELLSLIANDLGYRTRTCTNGEEAVSLYKVAKDEGTPYSTVILDLTVPGGMGGKEAALHILAMDPQARLIVSSGYSDDPIMAEYVESGFCATLLKPYTMEGVARTLASVCRSKIN